MVSERTWRADGVEDLSSPWAFWPWSEKHREEKVKEAAEGQRAADEGMGRREETNSQG